MADGWVCPECGLDYDKLMPPDMVVAARSFPRRYRELLQPRDDEEKQDTLIRRRPDPKTWSALEYTAHVADALDVLADTVRAMAISENLPIPEQWDADERAAAQRYNEMDREEVLTRLAAHAEKMAKAIEGVNARDWSRTATFRWGERDAMTMARNAVHEGSHHLRDVERVLNQVRGQP